jgi:hypothetical protein
MVETVHMGDTDVHKKVLLKLIDLKRIRWRVWTGFI